MDFMRRRQLDHAGSADTVLRPKPRCLRCDRGRDRQCGHVPGASQDAGICAPQSLGALAVGMHSNLSDRQRRGDDLYVSTRDSGEKGFVR